MLHGKEYASHFSQSESRVGGGGGVRGSFLAGLLTEGFGSSGLGRCFMLTLFLVGFLHWPLCLTLLEHGWRTLFLQLFLPISLYTDSLCWISITLPGLLGKDSKSVPGLLCLTNRVYLVHRKNSCGLWANSGYTN